MVAGGGRMGNCWRCSPPPRQALQNQARPTREEGRRRTITLSSDRFKLAWPGLELLISESGWKAVGLTWDVTRPEWKRKIWLNTVKGNDWRKIKQFYPCFLPKIRLFKKLATVTWLSIFSSESHSLSCLTFSKSQALYMTGLLCENEIV